MADHVPVGESEDYTEIQGLIYDTIRDIRDPEKPETLEELEVVYEEGISVTSLICCGSVASHRSSNAAVGSKPETSKMLIRVEFKPTVPHCSLATLIGLCIRVKLQRDLPEQHKLDIYIKKGTHSTEDEINKQINDKERVAAALENPNLLELVDQCIKEPD